MSDYIFLFDLDATITKQEILPELAKKVGCFEQIRELTEQTMQGEIPFEASFLQRVEILKAVPVSRAREIVAQVQLHEEIVRFIKAHRDRCRIITGNLDIWIRDLLDRLGMRDYCYCSHGREQEDRVAEVTQVINKKEVLKNFTQPLVAIGDGDNDAELIAAAQIGIGFGGVRRIAPSIMENADYAIYTEEKLCQLLKQLL